MNASANEQSYGGPEQEIFKHAFSDPIIENEMLYPALTTLDDIYEANAALLMPVEHFFTAYENLQIESAESLVLDGGLRTSCTLRTPLAAPHITATPMRLLLLIQTVRPR